MLLAKGADVNRASKDTTALLLALSMGDTDMVRLLIRHGADVNAVSPRGELPLRAIIRERLRRNRFDDELRREDVEKMRLLLDAGADVRARAKDGSTPLHLAAHN